MAKRGGGQPRQKRPRSRGGERKHQQRAAKSHGSGTGGAAGKLERPTYPDQLEGRNLVLTALEHSRRVREVWVDERARPCPKLEQIKKLSERGGTTWRTVARDALEAVSRAAVHNGVIGFAEPLPSRTLHAVLDEVDAQGRQPFVLLLDQVQYEQNLGAVLRSAACSGVDVVVTPTRRGASLSANAQRVAMGAAEQVPVVREGMMSALATLRRRGIRVVAAEAEAGQPYFEVDLTGPLALVMGGEDHGVGAKICERADQLVNIPIRGDVVTSLNVSVATGVLLFERVRQQQSG